MNHLPKKKFGQNFLIDQTIIQQIIDLIAPKSNDHLIEIGPGLGAITFPLLALVQRIDAIELDRDVIPLLKKNANNSPKLIIHEQDALNLALSEFTNQKHMLRIVGNLPYNISTPLLFHLLSQTTFIMDMHFMLQKEVGERLAACPGSKKYGRLSVMTQYYCEAEMLLQVPPHAFTPPPKVQSQFIRLSPKPPELIAKNWQTFYRVVKEAFSQRRKTLYNTLKHRITKAQLLELNIDPSQRPEELSVSHFVQISNFCNDLRN